MAEFEKVNGAGRANKLKSNARAIRRLRTACENAKRSVSSAPTTTLEVSGVRVLALIPEHGSSLRMGSVAGKTFSTGVTDSRSNSFDGERGWLWVTRFLFVRGK